MNKFKLISPDHLTEAQAQEFSEILKKASEDKYLQGEDDILDEASVKKVIVLDDSTVAGFFSPTRTSMKAKRYWRAGALFLDDKFRGKGLMTEVLKKFFADHNPGIAWIADSNKSSISLFSRLGFKQYKPKEHEGEPGYWYVLE